MNSIITWVNALGNLGTKETTEELLKVVEGKITKNTNPRSMAVYLMIRPAREISLVPTEMPAAAAKR